MSPDAGSVLQLPPNNAGSEGDSRRMNYPMRTRVRCGGLGRCSRRRGSVQSPKRPPSAFGCAIRLVASCGWHGVCPSVESSGRIAEWGRNEGRERKRHSICKSRGQCSRGGHTRARLSAMIGLPRQQGANTPTKLGLAALRPSRTCAFALAIDMAVAALMPIPAGSLVGGVRVWIVPRPPCPVREPS